MAGWTGLEPAAFRVTGRRYNQLNYHPANRDQIYNDLTDTNQPNSPTCLRTDGIKPLLTPSPRKKTATSRGEADNILLNLS